MWAERKYGGLCIYKKLSRPYTTPNINYEKDSIGQLINIIDLH